MIISENLNDAQREAVLANEAAILVVAGAGSGKTKVLVSRIAHLLAEQKLDSSEIMAVTFTNKAAKEMRERLWQMTGLSTRMMWIGTFHALCGRILRAEGKYLAPITAEFNIFDDTDSKNIIKRILIDLNLSEDKKFHHYAVLNAISEAKNNLLSPDQYAAKAADSWQSEIAKIYERYEQALTANNALDFDDLIVKTVKLLQREKAVLSYYQQRFKHILVDEYQDTNHSQYMLVKLLTGQNGNLFVVGDPDQSIYRWRGADISNILDFNRDYPNCKEIKLVDNYRSSQNILDAANALIANNQNRKPKDLIAAKGAGEKISLHYAADDREEAFYITDTILRLKEEGFNYNDCVILYRTHGQSRVLEDQCRRFSIPYRVYGGMKFYDRKEVKDTLAYLRVLANNKDGEALNRIYNEPKRGIGKATWDKLLQVAAINGLGAYQVLGRLDLLEELNNAALRRLDHLHHILSELTAFAKTASIKDLLERIWQDSGYYDMLEGQPDGSDRKEILAELFNIAASFDEDYADIVAYAEEEIISPLSTFLAQLALATDMDNQGETEQSYLTLMTMHAAKGLEFPIVFLSGMEDGLFPHQRVLLSMNEDEMEEERRLCYVGLTRAEERLYLSVAHRRQVRGHYERSRPSRFIGELPTDMMEKSGLLAYKPPERQIKSTVYTDNVFAPTVKPKEVVKEADNVQVLKVGDKVRHAKFGDGMVVAVEGSGDKLALTVAFPGQGLKKLLWRYAPLQRV